MLKSLGPSSLPFSPKRGESLTGDSFMPFQSVSNGGTLSFSQSIGLHQVLWGKLSSPLPHGWTKAHIVILHLKKDTMDKKTYQARQMDYNPQLDPVMNICPTYTSQPSFLRLKNKEPPGWQTELGYHFFLPPFPNPFPLSETTKHLTESKRQSSISDPKPPYRCYQAIKITS